MADASPSPPPAPDSLSPAPLSKNARKRLLKAERVAASKADRRARDKQKKRARAEKRRAGDPDALADAEQTRRKRRKLDDPKAGPRAVFHARVVVDLAFDALMSEKVRGVCRLAVK
jgi:tRNA (guanine9-N1)-methyltransferase